MTDDVLIGLGTNVPFGALAGPMLLEAALSAIEAAGVKVVARSGFWASPAWPPETPAQADFTNAVARVNADKLSPEALYEIMAGVERAFGRERRVRWAARTLDIDILDFDGLISEGALSLPHPRLHERAFVLAPLAEVAPEWRHPLLQKRASDLLAVLENSAARLAD